MPRTHNYAITHRTPGLSEEQISDIFSGAGKVLNFRLVYDRETGRPKGFGFAEYPDAGRLLAPKQVLKKRLPNLALEQIRRHQQSAT